MAAAEEEGTRARRTLKATRMVGRTARRSEARWPIECVIAMPATKSTSGLNACPATSTGSLINHGSSLAPVAKFPAE